MNAFVETCYDISADISRNASVIRSLARGFRTTGNHHMDDMLSNVATSLERQAKRVTTVCSDKVAEDQQAQSSSATILEACLARGIIRSGN